ncbi:MAG: hypothetical protein ACFCUO_04375 [Rhodospirillales bacterium]
MGRMRAVLVAIGLWMSVGAAAPAMAADAPLQSFFGAYEGTTEVHGDETRSRELRTIIRPFGEAGFSIRWRTLIFKTDRDPTGRTQVIYFEPLASNPRIYAATDPDEATGIASDLPLDGGPFAWARIAERTLTVHVLTISEAGDYVLQSYDRTLTDDGLVLAFVRIGNGEVEHRVGGVMRRVAE